MFLLDLHVAIHGGAIPELSRLYFPVVLLCVHRAPWSTKWRRVGVAVIVLIPISGAVFGISFVAFPFADVCAHELWHFVCLVPCPLGRIAMFGRLGCI